MKVTSEECETLLSSGVHLPRSKSDLEHMAGDSIFSLTRKASRSEAVSRVHWIPVLMVFVFFVLWVASSEVNAPDLPKVAATTKLPKASEVHLKVINNDEEVVFPGTRTMLFQDESSSHPDHAKYPSFRDREVLGENHYYIKDNARINAR